MRKFYVVLFVLVLAVPSIAGFRPTAIKNWGDLAHIQAAFQSAAPRRVSARPQAILDRPTSTLEFVPPILVDQCVNDRLGDQLPSNGGAVVDLLQVCAGTDGNMTRIELLFSPRTTMGQLGGYLLLDLDQDASTGFPPTDFHGIPPQNPGFGTDAVISLFEVSANPDSPMVVVYMVDGRMFNFPANVVGTRVFIDLPMDALGDDGNMSLVAIVGDRHAPTDWAPEQGNLSLLVAAGKFFPETTRFLAGQNFDLVIVTKSGVSAINKVRTFVNDLPVEYISRSFLDVPSPPNTSIFRLLNFGKGLAPGVYKLDIGIYTDRGVFGDSATFTILRPLGAGG